MSIDKYLVTLVAVLSGVAAFCLFAFLTRGYDSSLFHHEDPLLVVATLFLLLILIVLCSESELDLVPRAMLAGSFIGLAASNVFLLPFTGEVWVNAWYSWIAFIGVGITTGVGWGLNYLIAKFFEKIE